MKLMALSILVASFVAQAATSELLPRLPKEAVALHKSLHAMECDPTADIEFSTQVYNFGQGATLFIVPCMMGAYNSTSVAYLKQGGRSIEPVMLLTQYPSVDGEPAAIIPTAYLTDVSYDEASRTLYTNSKGRGMGDCGTSSVSKISLTEYGGAFIKTVEVRSKQECDGNTESEWPVVFQQ